MNIFVDCIKIPENPSESHIYRLLPAKDEDYYRERTDRNIGWISAEEQKHLHSSVIAIAGCGGMGGLLASIFTRLGVGEVRIADCEHFDVSNINRQFAATRSSIGKSKAFETARMLRDISDDTTIVVYPQGIIEQSVSDFLEGTDIVCDEIEFWAAGSRILLHQEARKKGISLFNCNTVGFASHLFLFEPQGFTMEDLLGLTYEEAKAYQDKIQKRTASSEDIEKMMISIIRGLVPEISEHSAEITKWSSVENIYARLFKEGRASIIATNPAMAAGFLANHVLFYLLRDSPQKRNVMLPVAAPGYLYLDIATHTAKVVERKMHHE